MPNPKDASEPPLTPGAVGNSAGDDTQSVNSKPRVSLWDQKPWWCQPWTIVLSGLIAIAGSWWLLQTQWITALVGAATFAWWLLFLVLVPRAYQQNQS